MEVRQDPAGSLITEPAPECRRSRAGGPSSLRRCLIAALALLLLTGCLVPGANTVGFDATAGARLATTVTRGLFLTTVRIAGRDVGPFLIDTGANALVLDAALAQSLPVTILSTRDDAQYRQTIRSATLSDLSVGPVTLHKPPVLILDLSPVASGFGERLAGVLGYPFFASTVVEIDYARRSVSCFDPVRYRLPRGAWQPLAVRGQHPGVAARMDGGAEGMFLLDTGSTTTVTLFPHFLQKHTQLRIRSVQPHRRLGVDGERDVLIGQIAWFELSGRRLERPWVMFEKPDAPSPREAASFDGLIGEGVLRQFVVVFNYPAGQIAFLPNDPP